MKLTKNLVRNQAPALRRFLFRAMRAASFFACLEASVALAEKNTARQ